VGNLGQVETAELRRDLAEVNAQVRSARSKEEQAGCIKAFTLKYPLTSYAHGYMNYLARLYADMGRQQEAEALFERARSLARTMGTDKELEALIGVTGAYLDMAGGRYDQAESALRRLIPAPREALQAGTANRDKFQQRALWAPVYLARVLEKKGQLPQARATMEEAVRRLTDLYNHDPRADWVLPHLSQAAYWHLDLLLRNTPGPDMVPNGEAFVEQFRRSLPDTAALAACCRRLRGAIESFEKGEHQMDNQALP
jgi:tetratricopeptide (TPR) repeat protein